MTTTVKTTPTPTADAFAERLFTSVLATMDVHAAYLGARLGWYRALATGEALTST